MDSYLDHAATTPMIPEALDALTAQIKEFGNASSLHTAGRAVRKKVEEARETIAAIAGCAANEVIFTGSGTEANNLAIKGFYWKAAQADLSRNVVVVAAFEHHATLEPVEWLEEHEGAIVIHVPVLKHGLIDLDALAEIIRSERGHIALILCHALQQRDRNDPTDCRGRSTRGGYSSSYRCSPKFWQGAI
ncbi:MAG: aminotransferase class V-fold PLP-dependent enzyme [Actinomycetota bacterium]